MTDAKLKVLETARALGLTVEAEFVPWSKSRNKDERATDWSGKPTKRPQRSLNWKVTLKRGDREILTTDYGAGTAHCPGYRQGDNSVDQARLIEYETEVGLMGFIGASGVLLPKGGRKIVPDTADVIASLARDSDVLDAAGFEEWASDLGFDTDSRKAEAIYRACLEIALKLRAAIGEDGLTKLREAASEY